MITKKLTGDAERKEADWRKGTCVSVFLQIWHEATMSVEQCSGKMMMLAGFDWQTDSLHLEH